MHGRRRDRSADSVRCRLKNLILMDNSNRDPRLIIIGPLLSNSCERLIDAPIRHFEDQTDSVVVQQL